MTYDCRSFLRLALAAFGNQLIERDRIVAHPAVAFWTAFAAAAATPQMPSSATPFAFMGNEIGSISSRKIMS
jgi:hypothetical protein